MSHIHGVSGALVVISSIAIGDAWAQTTAHQIPYQGRLDLSGLAVSGTFDFWFELYPTPTGGDCQVTAPPHAECLWADELSDVDVAAGNFAVVLGSMANPLGDAIWQNGEVYLGIRVAATGDAYTPLAGRQRILAVPMAARAETAKDYHVTGTLDVGGEANVHGVLTVDGDTVLSGGLGVIGPASISGNLGLGTAATTRRLEVAGDVGMSGTHYYGSLKDWRLVFHDQFGDGVTRGWTGATTSQCAGEWILGGFNVISNGSVQKTFDLTGIAHTEVKVTLRYFAIDSWDAEWAWVRIVGTMANLWTRQIWGTEFGRTQTCGNTNYLDGVYTALVSGSHSGDALVVNAGAVLSEAPTTESFGINHVEIWVR